jgi:hypothetical protein
MQIRSLAAGILAGLVLGGVAWAGHELKTITRYYVMVGHHLGVAYEDLAEAEHVYNERTRVIYKGLAVLLIEEQCSRRSLAQTHVP